MVPAAYLCVCYLVPASFHFLDLSIFVFAVEFSGSVKIHLLISLARILRILFQTFFFYNYKQQYCGSA